MLDALIFENIYQIPEPESIYNRTCNHSSTQKHAGHREPNVQRRRIPRHGFHYDPRFATEPLRDGYTETGTNGASEEC